VSGGETIHINLRGSLFRNLHQDLCTPALHLKSCLLPPERFHALDALRAFALLLGVCLHAALSFVAPPGAWAIGTNEPVAVPFLFVQYVHSFRMETFFLLAGFFARLVIGKRGVQAFLKDRAVRIVLVFVVALYPMKLMLSALWIIGGKYTGWMQLPPEAAAIS
jgi:peptidoglycan/LPS O-acetylase OafA/YrhL